MNPKIGGQEHLHLFNQGIKVRMKEIDLSDSLVSISKGVADGITAKDKSRILCFFLYSGLACIGYSHREPDSSMMPDVGRVIALLESNGTNEDLAVLFEKVSIYLTSPLIYTRLGTDILSKMQIDTANLFKGVLMGKMLEVYFQGAISLYSSGHILRTDKLGYQMQGLGEVDICNLDCNMLVEVGSGDKKPKDIHLESYHDKAPFIRVCTTKTVDVFNGTYYRIPYPKLCCMIDTKDILKLKRTVV
jgi:hypothetical protein